MKTYLVTIEFYGVTNTYEVEADNEHDAREQAMELAKSELTITNVDF